MTDDEYDAQVARLTADIEDARKTLNNARGRFDGLCDELCDLNRARREQLNTQEK